MSTSPMTPLSERLRKALALPQYPWPSAREEHARTAPIVELLLEGIHLLADVRAGKFKYYEDHTCEPYTQTYFDEIEQYMERLAAAIEGRG